MSVHPLQAIETVDGLTPAEWQRLRQQDPQRWAALCDVEGAKRYAPAAAPIREERAAPAPVAAPDDGLVRRINALEHKVGKLVTQDMVIEACGLIADEMRELVKRQAPAVGAGGGQLADLAGALDRVVHEVSLMRAEIVKLDVQGTRQQMKALQQRTEHLEHVNDLLRAVDNGRITTGPAWDPRPPIENLNALGDAIEAERSGTA